MRLKLAILSFFAFCTVEPAQQPQQQTLLTSDRTLSVDVDRVNVLFTVSNRRGRFITSLQKGDFQVFEDDQPQNITNFSSETDLPLNIALLIDTSGSIRDKLSFEQAAAAAFFSSILHAGKDRAFIMTFDTTVRLRQDYTDDPAVLRGALRKMMAGGSTRFYDAVSEAAAHRLAGQPGRRVIVVITDGMDNSSRTSL